MAVAIDQLSVLDEIKCQRAVAASAGGVVVVATAFGVVVVAAAVALDIFAESIVAESAVHIFDADGVASSSLIFAVVVVVAVVNNDAVFGQS